MPRRLFPRLGRRPGNAAALVELDHVVLPDAAIGERHQEHLTRATDALPARCLGQVLVAVPAWLLSWISDELEDHSRPGRDLTAGTDDARNLIVTCHVPNRISRPWKLPRQAGSRLRANALICRRPGQTTSGAAGRLGGPLPTAPGSAHWGLQRRSPQARGPLIGPLVCGRSQNRSRSSSGMRVADVP